MNSCVLILAIITFASCAHKKELVGNWKAGGYTFAERSAGYIKGARALLVGKELRLNSDSTFILTSRGLTVSGDWIKKDQFLLLSSSDPELIVHDSTTSAATLIHYELNQGPFIIRRNKLIHYYEGNRCIRRKPDGSIKFRKNHVLEILK